VQFAVNFRLAFILAWRLAKPARAFLDEASIINQWHNRENTDAQKRPLARAKSTKRLVKTVALAVLRNVYEWACQLNVSFL
jgi:hypothetical protein